MRILAPQALGLRSAGDQQQQTFCFERLLDKVHRAAPHRRDSSVDIAVAREDDHRQLRLARLDGVEHFKTVHLAPMQPHIEQHQAGAALINGRKRARAIGSGAAGIAFIAQHA